MPAMLRGARATSRSPIASATSCCQRGSFSKTRPAGRAGGGDSSPLTVGRWPPRRTANGERPTMIGYLQGTLKTLEASRATIVTNCVGYEVHISLQTYHKLEGQREAALEIYTHVREDTLALYGFATTEEKSAFEKLISISGIGPTLAQKILSGIEPADLADAVARGDARKLTGIPGVGKKTAERICLELRDKLVAPAAVPAAPAH